MEWSKIDIPGDCARVFRQTICHRVRFSKTMRNREIRLLQKGFEIWEFLTQAPQNFVSIPENLNENSIVRFDSHGCRTPIETIEHTKAKCCQLRCKGRVFVQWNRSVFEELAQIVGNHNSGATLIRFPCEVCNSQLAPVFTSQLRRLVACKPHSSRLSSPSANFCNGLDPDSRKVSPLSK